MTEVVTPLTPFKCPICASKYFGPVFEKNLHIGRYCKGWPLRFDRSYEPCPGNYEEKFSHVT